MPDVQPQPGLDLWRDAELILQYHFMRNAFAAGTLVALLAGLVGYFMVLRGQTFAGHTLSQVGFPGAAGAALVGAPPLLGLIVFCTLAAVAIGSLPEPRVTERRMEAAAVGSILAFALALGFLFASLYRGFVDALYAFLFGTFIGIGDGQVLALLLVTIVALACLAAIGRPLLFASIDPDVAAARGAPVRLLSVMFLALLGLAVAGSALITGTLLVFALLVAPAATARQLTARPVAGMILAVLIGVGITWLALSVAYFTVYPIGFFITTLGMAAFLMARASRWWRSRPRRPAPAPA